MSTSVSSLPLVLIAASSSLGSHPAFAARYTNGRCRETTLALQTPLPAQNCRPDRSPNGGNGAKRSFCSPGRNSTEGARPVARPPPRAGDGVRPGAPLIRCSDLAGIKCVEYLLIAIPRSGDGPCSHVFSGFEPGLHHFANPAPCAKPTPGPFAERQRHTRGRPGNLRQVQNTRCTGRHRPPCRHR